MTSDAQHAITAAVGLALIAAGTWLALGPGWSMVAVGVLLLSAVIYARRSEVDARESD